MSLRLGRRLHFVPRWVVVPTIQRQVVGLHAFGVARAAMWLLERHVKWDDTEFVLRVVSLSLTHDDKEAKTGDNPSPSKDKGEPDTSEVNVVVKVADVLEAIAFINEEKAMGNQYGMDVILADLHNQLQFWWLLFPYNGVKPITSDLRVQFLAEAVPVRHRNPHPAMGD